MGYTYDAEKFKRFFESSFTWLEGFMINVRRRGDCRALIDPAEDKSWTYSSLNREVNKLANALSEAGFAPGDEVLYQLYNSPQFVFCYIAPQKLGGVNSPVNFNFSSGETAAIMDRDRPKVYVYDIAVKDMARKALETARHKPDIVIAVAGRGEREPLPPGHFYYEDFVLGKSEAEPERNFVPDMYSEVTRLCTSGTTGLAKGVPLNNVNEVLSAHDTIMSFPLSPEDVTMNMTPWFHRGGLHSGGPTPTLYVGGTVVIMRMFSAKTCFDCVEKYGITFLIGVPSALGNLASRQQRHPTCLKSLKGIITMGSPLSGEDCRRFQNLLTPRIFNGYGTTETFWNSFLRPEDLPEMAGTAGASCTGDEIRVVRVYDDRRGEPDEIVPKDGKTPGEIIVFTCGKSSLSYADNPQLTRERYHKGWFYTKDIGVWDEKGYVTVTGRRDNMIICMGENIYPEQLEEVIKENEKVSDCMVVGVPDESRGQAVAAYVVAVDESLTVKELNHFCVNHGGVSKYKCPRYYAIVSKLPYNSTGKKQHAVLRSRAKKDLEAGVLRLP